VVLICGAECERACEEMDREGQRVERISLVPLSAARFAGPLAPQLVLSHAAPGGARCPSAGRGPVHSHALPQGLAGGGEEWRSQASLAQQELDLKALQSPVELYKPKVPVKASLEPADDLEAWLFG